MLPQAPRSDDLVTHEVMRLNAEVEDAVNDTDPGPDVRVVIVAFGTVGLLERCLSALRGAFPVLIVDNSSDEGVRRLAERFGAEYEDPGRNLGFAGAVNIGIERTGNSDVLLLNPDAELTPESLAELVKFLRVRPKLAAVAPVQVTNGSEARVTWLFPSPHGAWMESLGLGRFQRGPRFLNGSVLLLRREAIDDVGAFDDDFFLYAEETDWQRRALDRGWEVAACPDAKAAHFSGGTSLKGRIQQIHFHASRQRYILKHHGRVGLLSFRVAVLSGKAVRSIVSSGSQRRDAASFLRFYWPDLMKQEAALGPWVKPSSLPRLKIAMVTQPLRDDQLRDYANQVAAELVRRGHEVWVNPGADTDGDAGRGPRRRSEQQGAIEHVVAALQTLECDLVHVHIASETNLDSLRAVDPKIPVVVTLYGDLNAARFLASDAVESSDYSRASFMIVASANRRVVQGRQAAFVPTACESEPQVDMLDRRVVMVVQEGSKSELAFGLNMWSECRLAGDGWKLVVCESTSDARPIDGARDIPDEGVEVICGCTSSDFDRVLSESSIFFAPGCLELQALYVTRAMAHGLVTIVPGSEHMRSLVGSDECLYDPENWADASRVMQVVANDPERRRRIGSSLRARQRDRFSIPVHVDRLEAVYREVMR